MFKLSQRAVAYIFPLLIGLGAASVAAGASDLVATGPVTCDIAVNASGPMLTLEGVVHSQEAMSGDYLFRVTGPGANIQQGGGFAAEAGDESVLGRVMLGNNGTSYDVSLSINSTSGSVDCAKRVSNIA